MVCQKCGLDLRQGSEICFNCGTVVPAEAYAAYPRRVHKDLTRAQKFGRGVSIAGFVVGIPVFLGGIRMVLFGALDPGLEPKTRQLAIVLGSTLVFVYVLLFGLLIRSYRRK